MYLLSLGFLSFGSYRHVLVMHLTNCSKKRYSIPQIGAGLLNFPLKGAS